MPVTWSATHDCFDEGDVKGRTPAFNIVMPGRRRATNLTPSGNQVAVNPGRQPRTLADASRGTLCRHGFAIRPRGVARVRPIDRILHDLEESSNRQRPRLLFLAARDVGDHGGDPAPAPSPPSAGFASSLAARQRKISDVPSGRSAKEARVLPSGAKQTHTHDE